MHCAQAQPGFPLQLCGHFRLESIQVPHHRQGLVGLIHFHINPCHLVPGGVARIRHRLFHADGEEVILSGADFALHYCTRSEERTAFAAETAASAMARHVQFHVDDGAPEQ